MELPRGSFYAMHKQIRLHTLLHELRRLRFTGHIAISSSNGESAMVFREGVCILATNGRMEGNQAFRTIEHEEGHVSAVLSELTSTQVGLALEFNPGAAVRDPDHSRGDASLRTEKTVGRISEEKGTHPSKNGSQLLLQREGIQFQRNVRSQPGKSGAVNTDTGETLARDLTCLDQMDLESLAKEMKKNSKELVKGLQLDYLLEQGQTKGV